MHPKRILLLFSDTGGGHRSGAEAVAQALRARYGARVQVTLVDALIASQRWPFHRFPAWYPHMLRARSIPWKLGYRLTDRAGVVSALTRAAYPYVRPAARRLLQRHPADVIVSFHALLNGILARAMSESPAPVVTATVVLDFLTAHALWFARGLDRYFLPYADLHARADTHGLPPERLRAVGMPVRQEVIHARALSPAEARARLGLSPAQPLLLVAGGGEGMGPMLRVVAALLRRRPNAQIVALAGRNQALRARLEGLDAGPALRVEGFTRQMPLWLRAADVLVTKAGPNTLAEAFVMGLPTVLYTAIPGQEEGNVRLVLSHGAGVWAPHPDRAADAAVALLDDASLRQAMGQRAQMLASPEAAARIADELMHLAALTSA
jgi:1,2-diacylglycerol 3-beta-galactosyltransferase